MHKLSIEDRTRVVSCLVEGNSQRKPRSQSRFDRLRGAAEPRHENVVSGDSDLEPAAAWIREKHPKVKITVYLLALEEERKVRRNDYYESIGANVKFIPLQLLEKHQLPNPIPTKSGEGTGFERPKSWVKRDTQ